MKTPPPHRSPHQGFTLIEVLVSVAIVSILAAMLVGVSGKVMVDSKRSQCAANMRQIWQGTLMYVGENNGDLPKDAGYGDMGPWKINGERTFAQVGKVANLISPYVPDEVWRCTDPNNIKYCQTPGSSNFGRVFRKRPETGWMSGAPYNQATPVKLVAWSDLGKKYVFMCNAGDGPYPHNKSLNVLSMDGHVEIVKYQ